MLLCDGEDEPINAELREKQKSKIEGAESKQAETDCSLFHKEQMKLRESLASVLNMSPLRNALLEMFSFLWVCGLTASVICSIMLFV